MNKVFYRKKHGSKVREDWERVLLLMKACVRVEGVMTPVARDADDSTQTIVYDYHTFPQPLIERLDDEIAWVRTGEALARLHEAKLVIEGHQFSIQPYPLEQFCASAEDRVLLNGELNPGWFHGDFWHGNVFVDEAGEVIVIDPIPNEVVFSHGYIRASGCLDVAYMYMSILVCHPLRRQMKIDVGSHISAAESFLSAYLRVRGKDSDELMSAIRRLSRILAIKFIEGYDRRLSWPLARIKRVLVHRIVGMVDASVKWEI